jgi:hypothetical protein
MLEFDSAEIQNYHKAVKRGEEAAQILGSDQWQWLKANVFDVNKEDALKLFRVAKNEEGRLLAQQMYRAALSSSELVEQYVVDGKAALEAIKQVSNPEEGENNG